MGFRDEFEHIDEVHREYGRRTERDAMLQLLIARGVISEEFAIRFRTDRILAIAAKSCTAKPIKEVPWEFLPPESSESSESSNSASSEKDRDAESYRGYLEGKYDGRKDTLLELQQAGIISEEVLTTFLQNGVAANNYTDAQNGEVAAMPELSLRTMEGYIYVVPSPRSSVNYAGILRQEVIVNRVHYAMEDLDARLLCRDFSHELRRQFVEENFLQFYEYVTNRTLTEDNTEVSQKEGANA